MPVRAQRDSELSQPALHILLALGPEAKHGYAIMQDIATRSGGRIRILPGTLYSTIKKMLADGLVEEIPPPARSDSDDARRRYYRVTRQGKALAQAETQRLALLVRLGRVFQG
jgi:DNA-binding PadR family transcriptional regulator